MMKKIISLILVLVLCLSLAACGNVSISGKPENYMNKGKSFSIELPTSGKDDWIISEDTADDILNITDKGKLINIQIEGISKTKAEPVAKDLSGFQDYVMVNTLADVSQDIELTGSEVDAPDFIKEISANGFRLKNGSNMIKGNLVFMESSSCYYCFMIMAVDKAYDANKKQLMKIISSLKEL